MAKQNLFTAKKKTVFLQAYRAGSTVKESARVAGIAPSTAYEHRKNDAAFAAQMAEAKEEFDSELVARAEKNLVVLVESGHFAAIKFVLINRAPKRWSEKPDAATKSDIAEASAQIRAAIERNQAVRNAPETRENAP